MSTILDLPFRRALSILMLSSAVLGCHVSIHSGASSPKGGASSGNDPVATEKPKSDKPKTDKPKDQPKADKPKDKPKADPPKSDKPKTDKPKDDKPKAGKPVLEKPKTDRPAEKPAVDPTLPPDTSRLIVPVRAPFEKLIAQIDALLPKTQSEDYRRVTKDGDSVVVDVKYKAWRDPIEAKFQGRTLTVVVPVRYAANIRGKVKNPFGDDYFPLADGQTWGTSSSPQRIRLTVSLELSVDDEWKLKSDSKLEKIEHGSVPKGNFCAKVGIDVCTPKANLAGEIRKQIEKYLAPKIVKELGRADREIEESLDLRVHAAALWASLQKPLPLQKVGDKSCPTSPLGSCKDAAWLFIEPTSFGLSELALDDGDLGVQIGLEGKLKVATGKKPKVKVEPLPKPSKPEGSTAFQLRAALDLPMSALDKEISEALTGKSFGDDKGRLEVREVSLNAKSGGDITLSIQTKGSYDGTLRAHATLALDKKKGELFLEKIAFDDETKKVLDKELKGLDAKVLIQGVESAGRIPLTKESKSLRRAITRALDGALPGQLDVKGTLSDVSFVDLTVDGEVLHIRVELSGGLSLEYAL